MRNFCLIMFLIFGGCICEQRNQINESTEILVELGNGSTLMNLNKLTTLDIQSLDCQTNFLQVKHQLKMWQELLSDQAIIHHEIKLFSNAHKVLTQQHFNRHRVSNTLSRATRILTALKHNSNKRQHTLYQQWRKNEIGSLKHEVTLLQTSESENDTQECCDRIEKLINRYLEQRKHIAKQCNSVDVTINIINDEENKVVVRNEFCRKGSQVVSGNKPDDQQAIVGQVPPPIIATDPIRRQEIKSEVRPPIIATDPMISKQEFKVPPPIIATDPIRRQDTKSEVQPPIIATDPMISKQEFKAPPPIIATDPVRRQETKSEVQPPIIATDPIRKQVPPPIIATDPIRRKEVKNDVPPPIISTDPVVVREKIIECIPSGSVKETTKVTELPEDDDEEVIGEVVQTQGIAASGQEGRQ